MFTGIVEEIGTITKIDRGAKSAKLAISGNKIFSDLKIGDSVAVNGVCLTATTICGNIFTADVMNETLSRSSLGKLQVGSKVNMERAMQLNGRFGGHIVSGHIDGIGTIQGIRRDDNAVWYKIKTSTEILRLIVEKGSITIDGISLTVADLTKDSFSVSIIPHTLSETILGTKRIGNIVNLENDVIGKYVERLIGTSNTANGSSISKEFLSKYGF